MTDQTKPAAYCVTPKDPSGEPFLVFDAHIFPKEHFLVEELFGAAPQPRAAQPPAASVPDGVSMIAAERQRQKDVEGWTPAHDAEHTDGELAAAAACYASPQRVFFGVQRVGRGYEPFTQYLDAWPWAENWWNPKDRVRDLVRAGALIAAEIDRLAAQPDAGAREGAK